MHGSTKILTFGTIAASFSLALLAAPRPAAAAGEKLVAPVYPGAVRLSGDKLGPDEGVVFLVKDPHDKVQAFYVPKHARLPKQDEGRTHGTTEIPLIAQSEPEVTKIITSMKGDYTMTRATEVIVKWNPPSYSGGVATRFFFELQNQAKKYPGHDAELAALKTKYDWLGQAFVHPENKGEEILKRCSAESSGLDPNVDQAALAKQMAQLAKEGRYDEITELTKKLQGGDPKASEKKSKADNFGLWKACLEETAGYAYLTKLTIDRDPHTWDVKWK